MNNFENPQRSSQAEDIDKLEEQLFSGDASKERYEAGKSSAEHEQELDNDIKEARNPDILMN
jgi:hypothetical protein